MIVVLPSNLRWATCSIVGMHQWRRNDTRELKKETTKEGKKATQQVRPNIPVLTHTKEDKKTNNTMEPRHVHATQRNTDEPWSGAKSSTRRRPGFPLFPPCPHFRAATTEAPRESQLPLRRLPPSAAASCTPQVTVCAMTSTAITDVSAVSLLFLLAIALNHATDVTLAFFGFRLDGLGRVLLLVLVMFAFAGSLIGLEHAERAARPVNRRRDGRGESPAAQEQDIQAPRITLNPGFFDHGDRLTDIEKAVCLLNDEEFFRAVAEHLQLPACADLALDLYAVALGLDVDWRRLTVHTIKVQVLCEAVRKLSVDVALEQVVDFAAVIAPASRPVVTVELLHQVQWVLFTHRPFNDDDRTIHAYVQIIGTREGWSSERMVRVARASRTATVLGVAGRQREIVAAACAIVGGMTVEQIMNRYPCNRRAVQKAINQFTERGVVALLRAVTP